MTDRQQKLSECVTRDACITCGEDHYAEGEKAERARWIAEIERRCDAYAKQGDDAGEWCRYALTFLRLETTAHADSVARTEPNDSRPECADCEAQELWQDPLCTACRAAKKREAREDVEHGLPTCPGCGCVMGVAEPCSECKDKEREDRLQNRRAEWSDPRCEQNHNGLRCTLVAGHDTAHVDPHGNQWLRLSEAIAHTEERFDDR